MRWDRVSSAMSNPIVAGATVAAVGTGVFLAVHSIFGDRDPWPRLGDACSEVIYRDHLNMKTAARAWNYMPWIRTAADAFGIDPELLAALVHTESNFNPSAGSSAGAVGLSQHIASTALGRYRKLSQQGQWPFGPLATTGDPKEAYFASEGAPMVIDRSDPRQSLWLGAASMRALLDAGKGTRWALAAYNAGPAAANKPEAQWPAETRAYVQGVDKRLGWYRKLADACGQGSLT